MLSKARHVFIMCSSWTGESQDGFGLYPMVRVLQTILIIQPAPAVNDQQVKPFPSMKMKFIPNALLHSDIYIYILRFAAFVKNESYSRPSLDCTLQAQESKELFAHCAVTM